MAKHIVYALCFALISIAAASAQSPPGALPQATPSIKANVDEVVVDIVVRDKKGKPIYDLKPDDVTISDNGTPQKINSFRLVQGAEAVTSEGVKTALDPLRQIRLVTMVFEGMGNDQRKIARDAALDLIKQEQSGNVYYSVVVIASQLNVLQEFTQDKEALKKAIEQATSGTSPSVLQAESQRIKQQLSEHLMRTTGQEDQAAALRTLATAVNLPNGDPNRGPAEASAAMNRLLIQTMVDMLRFDAVETEGSRLSIDALLSLVAGQSRLPGRKTVLYFSWGMSVPPFLDDQWNSLISTANRANVTFYSIDTNGVMTARQNQGGTDALARATAASAQTTRGRAAVSVEEVRAADNAEMSMRNNSQIALRDLAESTGGFLVGESNDLRVPLRHIIEEVASYYEVSYNPGITNYDGSFRKLKVELARKGLVVHARSGYFALPADVRTSGLLPFEVPLLKAMSDPAPAHDVPFQSHLMRFQPTAAGTKVSVLVDVPFENITFEENKEKQVFTARLSLVALLKNAKGEVVQKFTRDVPLQGELAKEPGVKEGHFIYKEGDIVPPGRYTLETAVIDRQSGKIGVKKSAYILTAAGKIAISDLSRIRAYQAAATALDPDDPFQYKGGRITPTLAEKLTAAKNAPLSFFFVVYTDPANKAPATVELQYLLNGQVVGKGDLPLPPPDNQGRIPYIASSPTEAMPPGTYVIKAVAKQGDATAENAMTIEVEK